MASIKLKAFVHDVENKASGFIYAHLFTERGAFYLRISSADETGKVQVYIFDKGRDEMFAEATSQCRLRDDFVLADEDVLEAMGFAAKRMLVDVLREQHSDLFFDEAKAC